MVEYYRNETTDFPSSEMDSTESDSMENIGTRNSYKILKENETTETEFMIPSSRKSFLYPNSDVVLKHCLKPSEARTFFQNMDIACAANIIQKPNRFPGQNNAKEENSLKKAFTSRSAEDLNSLSNSLSLPKEIVHLENCDCFEYCECVGKEVRSISRSKSLLNIKLSDYWSNNSNSTRLLRNKNNADVENNHCQLATKSSNLFNFPKVLQSSQTKVVTVHSKCSFWRDSRHLGFCDSLLQAPVSSDRKVCSCEDEKLYRRAGLNATDGEGVSPSTFQTHKNDIKNWFQDFNNEQKNLILKELLEHCDMPQIHLLSIKLEPRLHHGCPSNCQDILTWLPNHMSLYIMSFLDPASLGQCFKVCRAWRQLANEPCLWRAFCSRPTWQVSTTMEKKQLSCHSLPGGTIHWKHLFIERYKLRNNWLRGRCNVRTFEGHTQGISCVQFDETRIVSGSSDKTIKIWNSRTNSPLSVQTLLGHSDTVRCLHLDGNRLVSGSTDRMIKVWDLASQQSWSSIACKVTMVGHLDTVRCLQVDNDKVISGSYDKTLKAWDIHTGQCKMTFRGHEAAVLCVQFDGNKIVSGSVDKTIKIWGYDGQIIRTLTGHNDAVTCLQFDDCRIISGSLDYSLKFWKLRSGECVRTIDWKTSEGHTRVVRFLQADSWRVVSASDDKTLKVWSIDTGKRLVTLRNHTDGVTCLQFNDSTIVSGSYDKTVKLWDFSCC